jgi:hypothetical protein
LYDREKKKLKAPSAYYLEKKRHPAAQLQTGGQLGNVAFSP